MASVTEDVEDTAARRWVTVLFCDLVDSTALSSRFDPEELRDLVLRYQKAVGAQVERFGGFIAQHLGDGLLVYFGYPVAREEDPRRAVHCGLAVLDAIRDLNHELKSRWDVNLAVRIGIHTGLGVAGEMGAGGRGSQLVVGQTPVVAERLEKFAEPNTVALSGPTHDLVRGFFDFEALGPQHLSDLREPVEVFRAVGETDVRDRFQLSVLRGLTPMVGRHRERDLLLELFANVKDGHGQSVLISGEAGIGKSRLQQWLKDEIAGEADVWLTCHCSHYYCNTALNPVIDMVERTLGFEREDSPEQRMSKLKNGLTGWGFTLPESVPVFSTLLSLPESSEYLPLALSPQQLKQETFESLFTLLERIVASGPGVFVVEDLHWADPSTIEFLKLLVERLPQSRILGLFSSRPESEELWSASPRLQRIDLDRLDDGDVKSVAKTVAHGIALPQEVLREIVSRTDGVPIFVEELTKMILDSDFLKEVDGVFVVNGEFPAQTIPFTLQDSLMSRLDRLDAGKELAQLGAVLGRRFRYDVLRAVAALDDNELRYQLQQLVNAEVLYEVENSPEATHVFRHALVQDAAYESLLLRRRRQLHERVAEVLRERFPETGETEPEILAHHFEVGGRLQEAVDYNYQAGQRASRQSAYVEAAHHLNKGLELLATLAGSDEGPRQGADSRERNVNRELDILLNLGSVQIATHGWSAPEVKRTYDRAVELGQLVGRESQVASGLIGLCKFFFLRGELAASRDLAYSCLELVQASGDPIARQHARLMVGEVGVWLGEFSKDRGYAEEIIELYEPEQAAQHISLYGQNPRLTAMVSATLGTWMLGYPEEALRMSRKASAWAQEEENPFSMAIAYQLGAWLHQLRGEVQETLAQAAELKAISSKHGFPPFEILALVLEGWGLAHTNKAEARAGAEQIMRALKKWSDIGARLVTTYYSTLLADAQLQSGTFDEGLSTIESVLADQHEERCYMAELHRLRGELQLGAGNAPSAEAAFETALDIAAGQKAKSFELRAAASLVRLLCGSSRVERARERLASLVRRLDDNGDTPDLRAAKKLLGSLDTTADAP